MASASGTRPQLRALRDERGWTQQEVAEQVSRRAVKQRGQRLVELAMVDLAGGDLDRACATASEAADLLRLTGYAFGAGRLRDFRRAVEPWASSAPVRALDEQLAAL